MAILLGVDTGGTYTDAVLLEDETRVLAAAKALTTRHDLSIGVGEAVRAVLADAGVAPDRVGLAALSTTLATNALVEDQGGRIALVCIGFRESDLTRHGLSDALKGDPVLVTTGGHNHVGGEAAALNLTAIEDFAESVADDVSAFAVAAQFATRNPAHEREAASAITAATGLPVTASHQLSARLNGPKRALTALLNARLVGMIDRLIGHTRNELSDIGISAPLMVVRGDGALMSAEQARVRPIETILSGPAASIVGARWLTGAQTALVSDIGGTTTDIALLRDGRPTIDPSGARVGAHRTMVEAVAMRTTGLGGDSDVHVVTEGLKGGICLGPRRVVPIALMAMDAPDIVHQALETQLAAPTVGEHDGRFVRSVPGLQANGLGAREIALLARIQNGVQPLGSVIRTRVELGALGRLIGRGLIQIGGATPTDAAHVLGLQESWDRIAATKALTLLARRRTGSGERLAADAPAMARMIVDQMTEQTMTALLETAFAEEEADFGAVPADLARHKLMQSALGGHSGLISLSARLGVHVIGLGASASTWYPSVGQRLGCQMILPEYAAVANAIGAVVGRVTVRRQGTVTSPAEGRYRVHLAGGPEDFADPEEAASRLIDALRSDALAAARSASAEDIHVIVDRQDKSSQVEARQMFIESEITVEASGRPRVAIG